MTIAEVNTNPLPIDGLIFVAAVLGLLISWPIRASRRVRGRKFYPKGDPDENKCRLTKWWLLEMQHAGLCGEPVVTHHQVGGVRESHPHTSLLQKLLNMVGTTHKLENEHVYSVEFPMDTASLRANVFTTSSGCITYVIYTASLSRAIPGALSLRRPGGFKRSKFAGVQSEKLNANARLLSNIRAALSDEYALSYNLFIVPGVTIDIGYYTPACEINPASHGCEIQFITTLRTSGALWFGSLPLETTFCLKEVVQAVQEIKNTI